MKIQQPVNGWTRENLKQFTKAQLLEIYRDQIMQISILEAEILAVRALPAQTEPDKA